MDKLVGTITISNAAPALERVLRSEAKRRNLPLGRTAEQALCAHYNLGLSGESGDNRGDHERVAPTD